MRGVKHSAYFTVPAPSLHRDLPRVELPTPRVRFEPSCGPKALNNRCPIVIVLMHLETKHHQFLELGPGKATLTFYAKESFTMHLVDPNMLGKITTYVQNYFRGHLQKIRVRLHLISSILLLTTSRGGDQRTLCNLRAPATDPVRTPVASIVCV